MAASHAIVVMDGDWYTLVGMSILRRLPVCVPVVPSCTSSVGVDGVSLVGNPTRVGVGVTCTRSGVGVLMIKP